MPGWFRRILGDRGERAAERFLSELGYRIVARQYRTRWGELDLIALDGDRIVFVEVKTRTSADAGRPEEAVTPAKQEHLSRAALAYLKRYRLLEVPCRFDVLSLIWPEGRSEPEIQHLQNAFAPRGWGRFFG